MSTSDIQRTIETVWRIEAARRRAIDRIRREQMADRKHAELGRPLEEGEMAAYFETGVGVGADAEDASPHCAHCHRTKSTCQAAG